MWDKQKINIVIDDNPNDAWEWRDDAPQSRVYLASNGIDKLVVLDWIGEDLECWTDLYGPINISHLGESIPSAGLWIWEGSMNFSEGKPDSLDGKFRVPNDEEWKMLEEEPQAPPWDNSLWLKEK